MSRVRIDIVVVAIVLGGIACVRSHHAIAEGPSVASPGPSGMPMFSDWHRAALGEPPEGVSAIRNDLAYCSPSGPGPVRELDFRMRRGWVQTDSVWGRSRADGTMIGLVCVFHPPAGTAPHHLANVRPLPSGAFEGALVEAQGPFLTPETIAPDGATFLLAGGVIVVARGSAVASTRAVVARSGAAPAPLPVSSDVVSWTFWGTGRPRIYWHLRDGARLERETYPSAAEAQRALAAALDVEATLEPETGSRPHDLRRTRSWWHGSDVIRFSPGKAK